MDTTSRANPSTPQGLLQRLALELAPRRLVCHGTSTAVVTTPDGFCFTLTVATERRKLITLLETVAHLDGTTIEGPGGGSFTLHHTGQLRRTGLTSRLRGPRDDEATRLRDRLLADGELERACLPLDVTRFVVAPHEGRWRASLRLMGGSYVRTRIPPGGSYVTLAPDQVQALEATLRVLSARLDAGRPATGADHPSPRQDERWRNDTTDRPDDPAGPRHLPRRSGSGGQRRL